MTHSTVTPTEPLIPELRAELLALAADRATAAGGASVHEGRPDDGVPAVHAPRQRSRDGRSAVGRVPSAGEGVARPWFRRPRRALAVLAVGGAAAVAAIAIVGPGGEATVPTPVRAGPASQRGTVPTRTVRQAQTEFAVFRGSAKTRPASSSSSTPGKATPGTSADGNLFALFPSSLTIVDPENARRLAVPDRDVWVAPGDRNGTPQICMQMRSTLDSAVVGTCGSLAGARQRGIFLSTRPAPDSPNAARHEYAGLLPDGVTTVTFLLRDGTTREEPVHDNAVAVASETGIRGVRFVGADGKRQTVRF